MYDSVDLRISWCNLCNSAPAEGKLEVYFNDDDGQPLIDLGTQVLDACKGCVEKFSAKDWYN